MKQHEYKQLVNISRSVLSKINLYDEIIFIFYDLFKRHRKYKEEVDYWLLYPNYKNQLYEKGTGLKKLKVLVSDIIEICKANNIQYQFEKLPTENWLDLRDKFKKNRCYCKYYYEGFDITDAIAFTKPFEVDIEIDTEEATEEDIENLDLG